MKRSVRGTRKCGERAATGSERGGRGGSRSPSAVDEAMEEEPEDTSNEGASGEGVWFAPCACACISRCLDFHSSNERNSAVVGSGSVDKGTRQQTGSEGLKEARRRRCSNGSKGEVALAVAPVLLLGIKLENAGMASKRTTRPWGRLHKAMSQHLKDSLRPMVTTGSNTYVRIWQVHAARLFGLAGLCPENPCYSG